jgi:DNA-binding GntR family transcriptional regulator
MGYPQTPAPAARGERTAEIVARRLSQAILAGELSPGSWLREGSLASLYGVSRTPIREALILLSNSGLIDLTPNRGAKVLQLTAADVAEIYQLRGLLEAEAVRLAAHRLPPDLADLLDKSCGRLTELDGASAAEQLAEDTYFHYGIAEASGSPRLYAMIRQVSAIPIGYRSSIPYTSDDLALAQSQHRAIAGALRHHRVGEASNLMRDHISWAGQLAVQRLRHRLRTG